MNQVHRLVTGGLSFSSKFNQWVMTGKVDTLVFLLISTLIIRAAAGHRAGAKKPWFRVVNKGIYRDDWHALAQWALTEMNSLRW